MIVDFLNFSDFAPEGNGSWDGILLLREYDFSSAFVLYHEDSKQP